MTTRSMRLVRLPSGLDRVDCERQEEEEICNYLKTPGQVDDLGKPDQIKWDSKPKRKEEGLADINEQFSTVKLLVLQWYQNVCYSVLI